jgi:hypothetical protein
MSPGYSLKVENLSDLRAGIKFGDRYDELGHRKDGFPCFSRESVLQMTLYFAVSNE